ncbi:MAG: glycosyltransferase family 4 protein [Lentimicrobiaceae bacterium]|nr:glycosyltransferase family 4 protein [Lentimicrobiaceae bacterium]
MRIGVNTRLFVGGKMDGIAWFSYEIIKRMVEAQPKHEFVFFFDRPYEKEFVFAANVKPVVVSPPARHPFLWFLFFEVGIRRALKKEKIDVFFSPDGWLCLGTKVKTLIVMHDLNFVHYPHFDGFWVRTYYRIFFPRFARKAEKIGTVSHFSKKDIAESYQINPNKICVAYNGAAKDFFEISETEKEAVRNEITQGIPYFVFVGTASQRKNVARILQAFDAFRTDGHAAKLVFVGRKKYWDKEMKVVYQTMKYQTDVIFTGYVSTAYLNKTLSSACALLYPSIFEGFGIPIVEAFACGVPVITSNTSSMPEVAGDAALLVSPFSVEEIKNAMETLFLDDDLRNLLIAKGKERLKLFSWDKSAQDLWEEIEKTCKQLRINTLT